MESLKRERLRSQTKHRNDNMPTYILNDKIFLYSREENAYGFSEIC